MPRDRRVRPAGMLPSGIMLRLGSMLVMLLIIAITIQRFRPKREVATVAPEAVVTEEAAPRSEAAPQPVSAVQPRTPEAPAPTPIEHSPEEVASFEHDAEAIADKSLTILPVEQRAYWQLIRWVTQEPLATLVAARPPLVNYQNLMFRPEKHRGELVKLELMVRRAMRFDAPEGNSAGVETLYELWGWPADAHGRMYTVVTPQLPVGFPLGAEITETATVYGYFFKLQGYELGGAKPYAAPQVSPLLVGRIQWTPFVRPAGRVTPLMRIALYAGCALILGMISFWIWTARRRPAALAMLNATLPASPQGDYASEGADNEATADNPPADPFRWVKEEDGHAPD